MPSVTYRLLLTVALLLPLGTGEALALTRVLPTAQTVAETKVQTSNGPSTGGGDTDYLSGQTRAKPSKPASSPVEKAETPPPAPVSPSAPASAAAPAEPPKTTEVQVPAHPVEAAKPQTPSVEPTATPVPPPVPAKPVEAAKPPEPAPATPSVAIQPQPEAATPDKAADAKKPEATEEKPKTAKAKSEKQKPTHQQRQAAEQKRKARAEQDRIVTEARPHVLRDREDVWVDEGPIPPRPIGRAHRRVVVEADDGEEYVIVRREPRCHYVPGLWFMHRTVCD